MGNIIHILLSYKLSPLQIQQFENGETILGEYQIGLEKINNNYSGLVAKETCYEYTPRFFHQNYKGTYTYDGTNCYHQNKTQPDYSVCTLVVKWVATLVNCPETLDSEGSSGGGLTPISGGGSPDGGLSGGGGEETPLEGDGFADLNGNDVLTVATNGAVGTPATTAAQLKLTTNQAQWLGSDSGFSAYIAIFEFLERYNNSQEAVQAAKKAVTNLTRSTDLTTLTTVSANQKYGEISSILLNLTSGLIFIESVDVIDAMKLDNSLNLTDWKFVAERKSLALRELQYNYSSKNFNFQDNNLKKITQHETEVSLLSSLKKMLNEYWPKDSAEWGALLDLMAPMLLEIGIEFIPGGGVFNSGKDTLAGISTGDYTAAIVGVVGIVMEFVPWTKLAKIAKKLYDVGKDVFSVFKVVYRFLAQVGDAIKSGLKTVNWLGAVKLVDEAGTTVAKISGNTVEVITRKGLKLVDPGSLKSLAKITPSASGNISQGALSNAKRFKPSEAGLKADFDNLKNLDNYELGKQSEKLADDLFHQADYKPEVAKIPGFDGNNGFDGVYIKKDLSGNVVDIIINEVKQVNSGAVKLNSPTATLPTQMSPGWIDNVLERMIDLNTPETTKELARLIQLNKTKITKVVTGIDKTNNEVLVLTIN
jgi:hypothetical protein